MNVNIPDKIIQKVSTFPSMPQAGIKLRALLAKEDVSTAEIEEILRRDPGLAANVLQAEVGLRRFVLHDRQAHPRPAHLQITRLGDRDMKKKLQDY